MIIRRSLLIFAALIICCARVASAQTPVERMELGAQFTSFTLFPPVSQGFQPPNATEPGFGGRFTYNLTKRIAIDSEVNFFPNKNVFQFLGEGRALQGQFGVKMGKRFKKLGVFAKARPGFLSVGKVFFYEPGASLDTGFGFSIPNARIARRTHLTADFGGVLEFYPSPRTIVRFDAGDTIVRYGQSFEPIGFDPAHLTNVPARIKHNFQYTAGVAFRLGEPKADPSVSASANETPTKLHKYEVGIQFTSLSIDPPTVINSDVVFLGPERFDTEPAFGGRFTYNLNRNLAVEAEGNFYPRRQSISGGGGHLLQSQFGVKAGHRWERFGLFGKIRPGMLTFTQVTKLVEVRNGFFGTIPIQFGVFRVGWKPYFSLDVGGVIEHYVTNHLMTRIDVGDTIVHYSEYAIPGPFVVSLPIRRRAPETHHNFQFTAGVGWRF
jgi:hypothetical protein